MSACCALRARHREWMADVAPGLSVLQNRATAASGLAATGRIPPCLATTGPTIRSPAGDQLGGGGAGRCEAGGKKRGEQTGPSPVDRGKCGTALHLVCAARARPLGVVVRGAKAN